MNRDKVRSGASPHEPRRAGARGVVLVPRLLQDLQGMVPLALAYAHCRSVGQPVQYRCGVSKGRGDESQVVNW